MQPRFGIGVRRKAASASRDFNRQQLGLVGLAGFVHFIEYRKELGIGMQFRLCLGKGDKRRQLPVQSDVARFAGGEPSSPTETVYIESVEIRR